TTFAPSRVKICDAARAMPEPAPVIKATFPSKRPIVFSSLRASLRFSRSRSPVAEQPSDSICPIGGSAIKKEGRFFVKHRGGVEDCMLDEYPKTIVLKNGASVTLRPLAASDADQLIAFFQRIPENERWYLRHDVSNAETVRQWALAVNYERVIPILAIKDGQIIGDATLHRHLHGSGSSVGEV